MNSDWNGMDGMNPVYPPILPLPQQQQQRPQQSMQKRPLDGNDQPIDVAAKRPRMDNQNYVPNFQQMQQPMLHASQFPPTPQSQHTSMQQQQQLAFPFSPLPPFPVFDSYNGGPSCAMQQPVHNSLQMQQQPQAQPHLPLPPSPAIQQHPVQPMQPSYFPVTSTPVRNNGVPPSFPFTPMSTSFYPTPPSDGLVPFFPSSTTHQTPVAAHPAKLHDDVVFKEVPSVLSLEGARKVKISLGEIRRRIGEVECMDVHQLARLTRHPKSSLRDFQKSFSSFGFKVRENEGRSKATEVIASLIEAEAQLLGKDFTKLISSELSLPSLAALVVSSAGTNAAHLVAHSESIRELLSCAREYLLSAGRTAQDKMGAPVDPEVQKFSLATHTFGPLAVVAVIESLSQLIKHIEKSFPTPEQVSAAMAPLPHLTAHSTSFSSSTSLNDSGLGCSFHSTPTTSPITNKRVSESDVDPSLLFSHPNDVLPYNDAVPPRIAYDSDPISIGELRRRALGPEKFTVSLMNSYLRKGKKVNTHNDLRDSLATLGITMKPLKGLKPTSWSSLSEMESLTLANQTSHFLSFLPASLKMREKAREYPVAVHWIKYVASVIQVTMNRIGLNPNQSIVQTEADLQILRFALITHHFGLSFFSSVMHWLQIVI